MIATYNLDRNLYYNPQLPVITHNCNLQLTIATYNSQLLLMTHNCYLWLTIAIYNSRSLLPTCNCYLYLAIPFYNRGFIKVLNRRAGLTAGQRPFEPCIPSMLPWKILKFYSCRDVFSCILKLQTMSFDFQKKITFVDILIMIPYPTHKLVHNLIDFRWSFMEYSSIRNALWGDSCFFLFFFLITFVSASLLTFGTFGII